MHPVCWRGSSPEEPILRSLNDKVITQFGLVQGVTHTEFIRGGDDGEFYFLETAARVGGAHIAELVEAASRSTKRLSPDY